MLLNQEYDVLMSIAPPGFSYHPSSTSRTTLVCHPYSQQAFLVKSCFPWYMFVYIYLMKAKVKPSSARNVHHRWLNSGSVLCNTKVSVLQIWPMPNEMLFFYHQTFMNRARGGYSLCTLIYNRPQIFKRNF